jgi:hypothetical protein
MARGASGAFGGFVEIDELLEPTQISGERVIVWALAFRQSRFS